MTDNTTMEQQDNPLAHLVTQDFEPYQGFKVLFVTDLHLYDKNRKTIKGAIENNRKIFDSLEDLIREDASIKLLVFGGDIQDHVPTVSYESSYWRKRIRQLGELMLPRVTAIKDLKIKLADTNIGEDIPEGLKTKGISDLLVQEFAEGIRVPLFAVRGNHDNVRALYQKVDETSSSAVVRANHTFFDDLLDDKLIINASDIVFNDGHRDFYIDCRNYGEAKKKIKVPVNPKTGQKPFVITIFHDSVVTSNNPLYNVLDEKDRIDADEVMQDSSIGIVNHLHDAEDPEILDTLEQKPLLWQIGSIARTSFKGGQIRDVGYSATYNTGQNVLDLITFDHLVSKENYFNYDQAIVDRQHRHDYSDLKLQYSEVSRDTGGPVETVKQDTTIKDEEVRQLALDILNNVIN